MKTNFKIYISLIVLFIASCKISAQARLTIENNSQRSMTVKVMRGTGKGLLHKTINIGSYNSGIIHFSESGNYFTKTKAVRQGKNPVYQKGEPFRVTNDETGYSVMTLTFSITESSVPQVTGGKQISKSEFDLN
ncbi:MAG: hypothetical protein L6264_06810 [Weeksellaceae bacterium]|nr:hypothetical protein [Bacteroidota bacterium]MCG2780641.1 hypothetical protein [Weeksellaceae bacterium]